MLKVLQNVEENDGYIMSVDGKDLYLYIHNKADTRAVDYGEDGADFLTEEICNVHVATNNKFFVSAATACRSASAARR